MKIYRITRDYEKKSPFSIASGISTWSPGVLCPVCELTTEIQLEPMTLDWKPSSDQIPDFIVDLFAVAVQTPVRRFFEKNEYALWYGKVVHSQSKEPKRGRKIVPFPYKGPKFHWILPTKSLWPDIEKSGMTVERWCSRCARLYYQWGKEIIIRRDSWNQDRIFSIVYGRQDMIYLTEQAVDEILAQRFEGFSYKLAGRIE